jgi:hypothetical protein
MPGCMAFGCLYAIARAGLGPFACSGGGCAPEVEAFRGLRHVVVAWSLTRRRDAVWGRTVASACCRAAPILHMLCQMVLGCLTGTGHSGGHRLDVSVMGGWLAQQ